MGSKKLTISTIADLAGVSKATVSRVLNGYPHIRPELRERVQQVIDETGFERNNVARLLATDRSNMIGLVVPSGAEAVFTDPYFPKLTQGISMATNQTKLTLALFIFHSEREGQDTIKSILANGLLDGLIITADRKDDNLIPRLIEAEMPFVLVGRPETVHSISYIDTDNIKGGYLATQYLIQQGYQRIGFVGSDQNSAGDDRYTGYRQALDQYQMSLNEELVAYGNFSMTSGENAMRKLLPARPDAVFVTSDTMALGALRVLREHQIRVPEDIAVIGYDDLPPAIQADPPLTTVHQPIERTGQLAVETLVQLIENPGRPPRQIILPVDLVVRSSA